MKCKAPFKVQVRKCAPRRRGGVPIERTVTFKISGCSPPTRGCSAVRGHRHSRRPVLPADAGVFRAGRRERHLGTGAPRRRGGVPHRGRGGAHPRACSPPTRGCSADRVGPAWRPGVLPADAGVFRRRLGGCLPALCAPRRRGGVPILYQRPALLEQCSPPTRGCSDRRHDPEHPRPVLPADAGVFRLRRRPIRVRGRAPRRRGGVPLSTNAAALVWSCSPPTRGCSAGGGDLVTADVVLPADAGVFPVRVTAGGASVRAPRRRGGVPRLAAAVTHHAQCSPPTRGCSALRSGRGRCRRVLPADAGVFRPRGRGAFAGVCAPRRRGGVPLAEDTDDIEVACSPPTRGCSVCRVKTAGQRVVLPADAGVFRSRSSPTGRSGCAPRRRGGVPPSGASKRSAGTCSPPTRGCSGRGEPHEGAGPVLPADAGVFRSPPPCTSSSSGAPRRRGGVPVAGSLTKALVQCSPPTRGCSDRRRPVRAAAPVLPADAGVFRAGASPAPRRGRAPRRRGGVPTLYLGGGADVRCSPPTRGCSEASRFGRQLLLVLPADAGVFRRLSTASPTLRSAPRRRGGVPGDELEPGVHLQCSPPTRGCSAPRFWSSASSTVLPADAGVFRTWRSRPSRRSRAPRRRGGVPAEGRTLQILHTCSPPTRGCSGLAGLRQGRPPVLPADAGVFRSDTPPTFPTGCAPRRRGGVPDAEYDLVLTVVCSPPTRGCSDADVTLNRIGNVLPADAGVFRPSRRTLPPHSGAPRRRGGVPE